MTPWYAWALFIGGPFLCAGAGAWVMWLYARRGQELALDACWDEGVSAGYRFAQHQAQVTALAAETVLISPGVVTCQGGHGDYCPTCHADAALERIRSEFGAARAGLGLVPDLWPGFGEPRPAPPLALQAAPGVTP